MNEEILKALLAILLKKQAYIPLINVGEKIKISRPLKNPPKTKVHTFIK